MKEKPFAMALPIAALLLQQCNGPVSQQESTDDPFANAISQPLVSHVYTADPSARVFNGRIYVYPSHDIDSGVPENDRGDHFDMQDYHVFSMDSVGAKIIDHGPVLRLEDIPWAGRQLWAPDAAYKDGTYFLYFPAKDKTGVFRIGVATSDRPEGPFKAEPEPIKGSYSIDPTIFTDDDGQSYLYFGGIWGGQLQRWATGEYDPKGSDTDLGIDTLPALSPKMARLTDDMRQFAEPLRNVVILDENGNPILTGDHERRFFEAPWLHKYGDTYYLSYSTGDTHLLVYATSDNPYGPFKYRGVILTQVIGWTTHHSIVEHNGKWWLFYHDTQLSKGKTHLRNIKVTELTHREDGSIETIHPYGKGE